MSETIEKTLFELVEEFDTGMLITRSDETIIGRPMSVAEFNDETGAIVFSTSLDTEKVAEITTTPNVAVVFQSSVTYVALSGTAVVSNDREKIKELYSEVWELWYPDGPEQEDIRLIVFTPSNGEYWDYSGLQGLKYSWKAIKAISSGEALIDLEEEMHAETKL